MLMMIQLLLAAAAYEWSSGVEKDLLIATRTTVVTTMTAIKSTDEEDSWAFLLAKLFNAKEELSTCRSVPSLLGGDPTLTRNEPISSAYRIARTIQFGQTRDAFLSAVAKDSLFHWCGRGGTTHTCESKAV
jgi:hypothetical protein